MIKKVTKLFCIIFLIFNLICSPVYAENIMDETMKSFQDNIGGTVDLKDLGEGTANIISGGHEQKVTLSKDDDTTSGVILILVSVLKYGVNTVFNVLKIMMVTLDARLDIKHFTIYDLVTGKYELFNLDFSDLQFSSPQISKDDSLTDMYKKNIIKFYSEFRNISIALSLFVLIYIGIRMAISTVAEDKSKYKKMLLGWVEAMIILTFMYLIVIVISYANTNLLKIITKIAEDLKIDTIEEGILDLEITTLGGGTGFHLFTTIITITALVYYELKFLITYISRFCHIAFLVVIAPIVTITYPIDKAGDGKAQAFGTWFKELTVKYFLQSVHAILYCFFMISAGAIAQIEPIVAVLFFMLLDNAEGLIKKIMNIKDDTFKKAKVPFIDKLLGKK